MPSPYRASVTWRLLLSAEAVLMLALGATGLIIAVTGSGPHLSSEARVLFFLINPAHGVVLILIGLVTLIAARWHQTTLWWALALCAGLVMLFLYGTGQSISGKHNTWLWLDPAENFLHGGLATLSFVILAGAAAVPWWRGRARTERLLGADQKSYPTSDEQEPPSNSQREV